MQNSLLIAVLAGLGGMIGWGLADFFAKKTIDQIGDVASLAWGHIFGTAVLVAVVLYRAASGHDIAIPTSSDAWFWLAFFGFAQAAVYLFVYKGFGKGQLAILNPVFASFSGLTAIFSIVIFKETVSPYMLVGLAMLFLGIIFISLDAGAFKSKKIAFAHVPGLKEILLATFLATFWTLYWDKFVGGKDWLSYALFMYIFMTAAILTVAWTKKTNLKISTPGIWKFLILIGLCETFAYLAISLGYSKTSLTSVVALLSGAFSLPTIILAKIFLKEKITPLQTAGSLVIVAAIMLLTIL